MAVIYKFDLDTWITMKNLKENINYMKSEKDSKFDIGIKKQVDTIKYLIRESIAA
jgi:hypothetical protein